MQLIKFKLIMLAIEELFWSFSILSVILLYLFRSLSLMTLQQLPSSSQWITKIMVDQLGTHLHSSHHRHLTIPSAVPDHQNGPLLDRPHNNNNNNNDNEVRVVDHIIIDEEPIVKLRRRPSKLLVPEFSPDQKEFSAEKRRAENVELIEQGRGHCLVSKKGRRERMEDRFKAIPYISGHPNNQAFFAVIDGHGGEEAANYVSENLGKNILKGVEDIMEEEEDNESYGIENAILGGYSHTDKQFLRQGVESGACAASVLLRNGQLYAANVGDCRVVLSRAGLATRLTNDHRLTRQDERLRIQNSGGFVHDNNNGIWRVQGTLAVSRAFGHQNLKEWIICEPEIQHLPITPDCDFLILASDGLWDKVGEQEAVDIVSKEESAMESSCKRLVDMSCSRGNRDDITVMVIDLRQFTTV